MSAPQGRKKGKTNMNLKPNHGHLGRRQRAVIDDLLNGLYKYESLEKNKISPSRYRLWLKNKLFRQELLARFDAQKRQGKFVMARCIPQAAEKLSQLIGSEKPEIARKACVDVLSLQKTGVEQEGSENAQCRDQQSKISDEKAARMLAILAEDEKTPCRILNHYEKTI
jgi:hypothetical protein